VDCGPLRLAEFYSGYCLKIVPETDEILRRLPKLKEQLEINVELASRDDFIPPLPCWQERSQFIRREGSIDFFHYDFYAQSLAKIERGHTADVADVDQMFKLKLIEPARLLQLFSEIWADLYKYRLSTQSRFGILLKLY
jgi:hypothetical protein